MSACKIPPKEIPKGWMLLSDCARQLGVKVTTVHSWINGGHIKFQKLSGRYIVQLHDCKEHFLFTQSKLREKRAKLEAAYKHFQSLLERKI